MDHPTRYPQMEDVTSLPLVGRVPFSGLNNHTVLTILRCLIVCGRFDGRGMIDIMFRLAISEIIAVLDVELNR